MPLVLLDQRRDGWTRFEKCTTTVSVALSMTIEVPVQENQSYASLGDEGLQCLTCEASVACRKHIGEWPCCVVLRKLEPHTVICSRAKSFIVVVENVVN